MTRLMEGRLRKHRDFLVNRIDPDFGLLDKLLANKTLTTEDVHEIKLNVNTTERKNRILLELILKKKKVDELIIGLRDAGQNHLVNYLNSDGEHESAFGDDWPLTELDISLLNTNRESLVDLLDTRDLCIRLFSEGVINNRQKQFISSKPTDAEKNEALLDILTKCSLRQYKKTIDCLNDSNQGHIAKTLSDGGVLVRVHANLEGAVGNVDEVEEEIISQFTMVLENHTLEEANRLWGLAQQRIFAAKKGNSIAIYIHCTTHDDLMQLIDQLKSDILKGIIEKIFTEMLKIGDALRVTLTWSVEEFKRAAKFFERTGLTKGQSATPDMGNIVEGTSSDIRDWMTFELEEGTAESTIIYNPEAQTEHQSKENDSKICEGISAEIERITSWSSAESSAGAEIADVDLDVYAAASRRLYWKQERRTFYKNFESLLNEQEELLNFFVPDMATVDDSDKVWDWEQRRTVLSRKLETLVDVQNYILKLLIPSETSSTVGLRQAVQNIDDKLKQQQQSWKNLKEQVLSGLGESKPSTSKPTSSTSIAKIGVRLHEVRFLKYALKKRGELSGKGDLFSALEGLMVEVSKEKQQTRDFRRSDKYLTFSELSGLPLQLLSDSEDEFVDDPYLYKHMSRKQGQMGSADLRYENSRLRRSFERTKEENHMLVKQLNETATARLEALNDFIALKAKLEATQNTEENETLKKLLEHQTPTVELPVKFRSDPILVQTIRTKAAEDTKIDIRGLTILGNELFVVTRGSPEVEVFDSRKLSFSRRWNLSELIRPEEIGSCSRNKCLYIIDSKCVGQPNEIMRIDPNGKLIKSWLTENDCGWGLSVTDESNVILALQARHKLREYSPDGQLICEINLLTEAGISSPWRAIKLTNGHFVVSHGHGIDVQHKVSIVDSNGKLQKSFGGTSGSTIAQMNSPRYLSVDSSGFVLVVDHDNSRVLLLDPDLEFRKELLCKEKHGLRFPERILLDESNGRLFVADFDGRGQILIFRLGTGN